MLCSPCPAQLLRPPVHPAGGRAFYLVSPPPVIGVVMARGLSSRPLVESRQKDGQLVHEFLNQCVGILTLRNEYPAPSAAAMQSGGSLICETPALDKPNPLEPFGSAVVTPGSPQI